MATRAEVLRPRTAATRTSHHFGRRITKAVQAWARKGQLGSSSTVEQGRYTGARV